MDQKREKLIQTYWKYYSQIADFRKSNFRVPVIQRIKMIMNDETPTIQPIDILEFRLETRYNPVERMTSYFITCEGVLCGRWGDKSF